MSTLHEALNKPLPPHTPPTAEPPRVSIAAIRTLPTDYYDAPTTQPSPKALAWDISPQFFAGGSGSGGMGLLQLDEGYEDEENYYSDEEEEEEEEETDGPDGEEDAEEASVFIGPNGGHLEIVMEEGDDGGDTDTSGSNNTSSGEVTPLVYMEGDEDSDSGMFGLRVRELVQDIEGETGGGGSGGNGGREKRGRETDKAQESRRRRNATDEEQDHDDGEDDDEEEKPAQVTTLS